MHIVNVKVLSPVLALVGALLFCGLETSDLSLYDNSPCSPDSSGCGQLIGAIGVECESPVETSTWGRIKATFE